VLETWRFLCRVAKIVVRDTRCPWVTPVQGVARVGLVCPPLDESLLCLPGGEYQIQSHAVALKLVALAGQDAQSQCRDTVPFSLDTFCLTHCLLSMVNPGTAPPSCTLCKTCSLKCLDIWQIPRRYKSLLTAGKPWDLFQPQICLPESKGRQINCDCWF